MSNDHLRPGAQPLPGYQLLEKLGQGGFGEVWKAHGPGGVPAALKFVRLAGKVGETEVRALKIMRSVRHPNLLSIFGIWQQADTLILAMELADQTLLDRHGQAAAQGLAGIPKGELLEYMRQAALGIDYLNAPQHRVDDKERVSIQHRDIKPQNILLVGGGVKVADFGLARLLEQTVTGHTGNLTMNYAAPEFFNGQTSQWSDQYSLAVTYCQLRGGRLPFTGNAAQVMAGHLQRPPDLTMLPEEERPAVARGLAKDPHQRWSNCLTLVEALGQGGRAPVLTPTGSAVSAGGMPSSRGASPGVGLPAGAATTLPPGSGTPGVAFSQPVDDSRWLTPGHPPPAPPGTGFTLQVEDSRLAETAPFSPASGGAGVPLGGADGRRVTSPQQPVPAAPSDSPSAYRVWPWVVGVVMGMLAIAILALVSVFHLFGTRDGSEETRAATSKDTEVGKNGDPRDKKTDAPKGGTKDASKEGDKDGTKNGKNGSPAQLFFPGQMLLYMGEKSVQTELKLSKDQIKQAREAIEKRQEATRGLLGMTAEEGSKKMKEVDEEARRAIPKILNPAQVKRLQEITLQLQGPNALADAEVAKELKLTADQKKQIQDILKVRSQELREVPQGVRGRAARQMRLAGINKEANEKIRKLLTQEQMKAWQKMIGEPFKGVIRFLSPRDG
jgi:hypothetical protein